MFRHQRGAGDTDGEREATRGSWMQFPTAAIAIHLSRSCIFDMDRRVHLRAQALPDFRTFIQDHGTAEMV
jgi:hypothetical protein